MRMAKYIFISEKPGGFVISGLAHELSPQNRDPRLHPEVVIKVIRKTQTLDEGHRVPDSRPHGSGPNHLLRPDQEAKGD